MNEDSQSPIQESSAITPAVAKKVPTSTVPKWEQTAKIRVIAGLKKLVKPTVMLKEKDAAEADTRHLVTDILVDVLGYDKYENLTAEFAARDSLREKYPFRCSEFSLWVF